MFPNVRACMVNAETYWFHWNHSQLPVDLL
jgi:hypothetical protein